ncbi:mannitol dehydrogenase family protein [Novosphingobium sp. 1949]|uniref:Mannitol dehydrogenase family protein n=1 Tax=Novosphingobium organovorum TaxID=2930092 RepID=A0ABT0BCU7_9SPHN|nr:mannitol dehydrogenase family protein [Novosphingobium organovorum]MCJ2182884.1 mannitol dehydrogenase family protein [Novosphingobium organovorum]
MSAATCRTLPDTLARFTYARPDAALSNFGIVHFGIGAFHRAHQAWYTDQAMSAAAAQGQDAQGAPGGMDSWAILGVSMRSPDVALQLNPQDGLFTVTECCGTRSTTRLVGSVRHVAIAPREPEAVIAALAAPTCRLATFTVTEKGYCREPDGGLDVELADKGSFYPLLAAAFERRRKAGLEGITLLSCDNLPHNGRQLARLIGEYLARRAPELAAWFEARCRCPSSMVDRIVPAPTEADRAAVRTRLGLEDAAAVVTEPFSQWVIEDDFAQDRPRWEVAGAQFVRDVTPYETAKLRMLNGAHSALAYLGLDRGHTFVHQAIGDPALRPLVATLMRDEAASTITAAPEQDLPAYAGSLLERFDNEALNHRLRQIAMDGSQKIPQRWLETLAIRQARGLPGTALWAALAAWLRHVRGDHGPVDDPFATELAAAWNQAGRFGIVDSLFGEGGILGGIWTPDEVARAYINARL